MFTKYTLTLFIDTKCKNLWSKKNNLITILKIANGLQNFNWFLF